MASLALGARPCASIGAPDASQRMITVGRLHGAFGVRGEVKLESFTEPRSAIFRYQPWVLRDARVTSALIGASRPEQIIENVGALKNLSFSADELAEIDRFAQEGGINLWEKPSTAE